MIQEAKRRISAEWLAAMTAFLSKAKAVAGRSPTSGPATALFPRHSLRDARRGAPARPAAEPGTPSAPARVPGAPPGDGEMRGNGLVRAVSWSPPDWRSFQP